MRGLLRGISLAVALISAASAAYGQYYSWGADRASLKWSQIEGDNVRFIYPDTIDITARRTMHYLEAAQPYETYGFQAPTLEIPFVMHPENFSSNGMVMWMPLRVEFLTTPATESYSMPWVKQLVAHEYRHVVQYSNLDRSTLKFFNYIFGQQGAALSLLFPPLYALEGDAVMMETNMSSYGRGLQPSFSMGYRALGDELLDKKSYLKWRCGSFTEYIPDHYRMGYQMMSYAYDKYNENILDKTFWYISRNPQTISPYSIALRKFYDTSTKELLYETFEDLVDFWAEPSSVENSAEIVSKSEEKNFVTYSHPIYLPDGDLLALKEDYKNPSRFVIFDPESSSERVVAHTGSVSTRPAYADGRVWWSEYRRSSLFEELIFSQLCYMDVDSKRPKRLRGRKNGLYPTPIGQSKEHIAYVEYNPSGQYSIVELIDNQEMSRQYITYPNEVHAMAWDNLTEKLYIIVTGDRGMWIEQQTASGFEAITEPAYISLSNLTARDGVLYFGSIASGKDEVHALDIASREQTQLSESKYGSFQGAVGEDGELYMTTYDKFGYHLSRQSDTLKIASVDYAQVPKNQVNPERKGWDVINLDTVSFDSAAMRLSESEHESKKYHKGTHLFNLHSWAPVRFDPFNILSEMTLDIGLGATLISQNHLSSCESYLSYGWDYYQGSVFNGGVQYDGLGVNLSLTATYGGEQNLYLFESADVDLKKYSDVSLMASLPIYLNRGYKNHMLTAYAAWGYSNGIVPTGLSHFIMTDSESGDQYAALSYSDLSEGLNKLTFGVSYSNYVRSATRDLATPLGYSLSFAYAVNPFNSEFSQLASLYGKLYTPGLAKNNSFTLAAAYQDNIGGYRVKDYSLLGYASSILVPHGFSYVDVSNNNYFAASAEYKFPICYPNYSLFDLAFFKRLSLGLGADYAQYTWTTSSDESIYSYGVDFIVDLNAISMTSASTIQVTMSLYKPQERSLYFQVGMSLPF